MVRSKVNPEITEAIDLKPKLCEVHKPRKLPSLKQEPKVCGVKTSMFTPFLRIAVPESDSNRLHSAVVISDFNLITL